MIDLTNIDKLIINGKEIIKISINNKVIWELGNTKPDTTPNIRFAGANGMSFVANAYNTHNETHINIDSDDYVFDLSNTREIMLGMDDFENPYKLYITREPSNLETLMIIISPVTEFDSSGANIKNLKWLPLFAYNCKYLKKVDLTGIDFSKFLTPEQLSYNGNELVSLQTLAYLANNLQFDDARIEYETSMLGMFENCTEITSLKLPDNFLACLYDSNRGLNWSALINWKNKEEIKKVFSSYAGIHREKALIILVPEYIYNTLNDIRVEDDHFGGGHFGGDDDGGNIGIVTDDHFGGDGNISIVDDGPILVHHDDDFGNHFGGDDDGPVLVHRDNFRSAPMSNNIIHIDTTISLTMILKKHNIYIHPYDYTQPVNWEHIRDEYSTFSYKNGVGYKTDIDGVETRTSNIAVTPIN